MAKVLRLATAMCIGAYARVAVMTLLGACGPLRGAQLPLRRYTTADGLANNAVRSIASDARGYLWFATTEGLSRFDGVGFKNQTESTGLPNGFITQLLIGRRGNYWLATPTGLVRFRPDLPQSSADRMLLLRPNGTLAAHISVILEDRDGTLWCGTESGLYAVRDTASALPHLTEVNIGLPHVSSTDSDVTALTQDAEGAVWIGVDSGALYRRLPDGRVQLYPSPEPAPHGQVTHLLTDRNGRLWVGRAYSLYRSIPASHPGANGFELLSGKQRGPPRARVFDIFQSREGDIWVGMYRYLAQFSADETLVHIWTEDDGLPSRGIGTLAQDRDGNLWMGTGDLGVFKLAAGGILTYSPRDGIGGNAIISISETVRGKLYLGGRLESEGFRISTTSGTPDSRSAFQAYTPRTPANVLYLGWRPARIILQDRTGEWWLATEQGLCRYPRLESPLQLAVTAPKEFYTTADGLPGNVMTRLYEDAQGNIWTGSEVAKFGYWSRSVEKFVEVRADGTPRCPSAFGEDNAGNVWIGDEEGQLWRVCGKLASVVPVPARKATIRAFLLDHAGRLWVATSGGGLLRLDQPTADHPNFRQFGPSDGLSSQYVYSLAEDHNGFIYLGTANGVDRLDPDLVHIRHYTSADGLAPGQVISAYCDRAGTMWFGTNHGLTRLIPRPDHGADPPPIWITGLSIAGRRASVSELGETRMRDVRVQPGQEQIEFDFVGVSYAPGNVLRYQYRLGNDDPWSAPSESRSVHFGAIAPGSYRFAVRAVSSDGEISQMPATVEFQVIPALWRDPRFEAILLAVIMAAAIWVHRVRAARLLAIERVRSRIASDLHDDIGSSLSQVAILSEVAYQRAGGGKSGEPIERIGELSREMLDSISDIVWAIHPHKDHLSDLKQRMRRFAADVLSVRNVEMRWSADDAARDVELPMELRQQVYLIFKESINNIARHAKATEVRIQLHVTNRQLALTVSDNGCGIQPRDIHEGNGLKSMKLRASRLGGDLQVRSVAGQGTTLLLTTPLPA
jgi:ligand-binding sensor domain-containing protein/signal transduction histidine kinase